MIKQFLESKYGEFVTKQFLTISNEVIWDNFNKDGTDQQIEVATHLKNLKDANNNQLVPDKFFATNVEWGMDFSSWIGEFQGSKDYIFIGAEPHVNNNYQLVYDFGTLKGKTIEETAQAHFNRDDIWRYLTKIFVSDLTPNNISTFLKKCYITDLSHIVPKNCGQIKSICETLKIEEKEWINFRSAVAKTFIPEEIKSVNPKYIILHGNASRNFFKNIFHVKYTEAYSIEASIYKILTGEFIGYKIISIPHLKGDVKNKLWKCLSHPERPASAKRILNELIPDAVDLNI